MTGNNKTILITGINGFLGSNLAKSLSLEYNIIGLEYTLSNLFRINDQNFKVYSIENGIPEALFKENKIDIIIHTATFFGKDNEDFSTMLYANFLSPINLLNKAIQFGCNLFINTDTVLDRFINSYTLTKRHFQEWLYMRRKEIKVINIKIEHFYGPGASKANFITAMIEQLKNNEPIINLTPGEQKRNFIYIEDVVTAYKIVLKKISEIHEDFTEFQVASNQLISIKELMLYLKKLTKSTSELNFGALPYRENEMMLSTADNAKLVKLGWKPSFSLKKGLDITLKNF